MIGYGDYILSTLNVSKTFIPLYNAETDELIKIEPDNDEINLKLIETYPMSDHLPLVVQLNFKKNDINRTYEYNDARGNKRKNKGTKKTKNKETKKTKNKGTKKTKNKETKTRERKKQI